MDDEGIISIGLFLSGESLRSTSSPRTGDFGNPGLRSSMSYPRWSKVTEMLSADASTKETLVDGHHPPPYRITIPQVSSRPRKYQRFNSVQHPSPDRNVQRNTPTVGQPQLRSTMMLSFVVLLSEVVFFSYHILFDQCMHDL